VKLDGFLVAQKDDYGGYGARFAVPTRMVESPDQKQSYVIAVRECEYDVRTNDRWTCETHQELRRIVMFADALM
jgi:hypothetical protein